MDITQHVLDPTTTAPEVRSAIGEFLDSCADSDGNLHLTADTITADTYYGE